MFRVNAQLSLLFTLALWARPSAVPWRDKSPVKFATTLPARLIDSIMAQGNWNILFQEGPFSEFQRQIAIANHFALRGEIRQADFYFQKAENALDIAYASLRGRFGWPRRYDALTAKDLAWGENRETFQDFLLCRIQLYLESNLAAHESGVIKFENFDARITAFEKQLALPVNQKDADLDALISFLRSSITLRNTKNLHPALLAEKFADLSDKFSATARNYWSRRFTLFCIFENIHYGNLGRALALTRYLQDAQREQLDPLGLARIFIQVSEYEAADKLLRNALVLPENRLAENFSDYLRYSEMFQNLLIWQKRYGEAEKTSHETASLLSGFISSDSVAREEIVDLKRGLANENFRGLIYDFLIRQKCPNPKEFSPNLDMEIEWRIRERIFHENCQLPRDQAWWLKAIKEREITPETRTIAAYYLAHDKMLSGAFKRLPIERKISPLTEYLAARNALKQVLDRKNINKIPEFMLTYLKSLNEIQMDFVLFDWGLQLTDDLTDRALTALPKEMNEKIAGGLFLELHRRFTWTIIRGQSIRIFSPPDASVMRKKIVSAILDLPFTAPIEETYLPITGKTLLYSDAQYIGIFKSTEKKSQFRLLKKSALGTDLANLSSSSKTGIVLFGTALFQPDLLPQFTINLQLAPLYTFCPSCSTSSDRVAERLVLIAEKTSPWQTLKAELADNFSTVTEHGQDTDCTANGIRYEDSIIFSSESAQIELPCNTRPDKVILEYDKTLPVIGLQAVLALGWRRNLSLILFPKNLAQNIKASFLFDFFQRSNRRQIRPTDAFRDAKLRAEKSFPNESALPALQLYESLP